MDKRQGAKPAFTPRERPLPTNFAEQLLQLEMDLEFHCTMETVNKLLELYSQAIEYYEAISDPKFSVYQERMQELILKPDVVRVLKGEVLEPRKAPETSRDYRRQQEEQVSIKAVQTRRLQRATSDCGYLEERNAQSIFTQIVEKSRKTFQTVKSSLKTQQDSIAKRLSYRRRMHSAKRRRQASKSDHDQYFTPRGPRPAFRQCESDLGGGTAMSAQQKLGKEESTFQTEFEGIMESFVLDKIALTKEIKNKYLPQIEDLDDQPQIEVVALVRENLIQQMNDEISQVLERLEEEKRVKIEALRDIY